MSATFRPRVLVIAEAANPEWVSVPLVGWSLASALRRVADVHLVTQTRNRAAILRAGLREGEDFTAIDSEAVASPMHRLAARLGLGEGKAWTISTGLSSFFSYPYFEALVWRLFRDRLAAGRFDLVHRITPLTPIANSSLAWRSARLGVPFVLGPLNGGLPWPPGFDRERRQEREWLSHLRGVHRLSPARWRMLEATSVIIAASNWVADEIPRRYHSKMARIPENAVDPRRFTVRANPGGARPLRACFIGRLVPLKGVDMLLEAVAPHLRAGRLTLEIVGSGPMEASLRDQAAAAGIDAAVTFHGWLPHARVQDILARCDLLAFPSIKEFGGGVILEAMATGVVPLVCDYGGPGELVDASIGYKVAMGSRAVVTEGIRERLGAIIDDPSDLPRLSRNCLDRVASHFTWDRKAEQMLDLYRWALEPVGPVPYGAAPASLPASAQGA